MNTNGSAREKPEIAAQHFRSKYNHMQVASFITVYQMRSVSIQELQGFQDALLELCILI